MINDFPPSIARIPPCGVPHEVGPRACRRKPERVLISECEVVAVTTAAMKQRERIAVPSFESSRAATGVRCCLPDIYGRSQAGCRSHRLKRSIRAASCSLQNTNTVCIEVSYRPVQSYVRAMLDIPPFFLFHYFSWVRSHIQALFRDYCHLTSPALTKIQLEKGASASSTHP